MGVFQRVAASVTARAHRVLDRFDEPAAPFDRARTLQRGLLTEARERLAQLEVEAAGLRAEVQKEQRSAERWEQNARERLAAGGEGAAREALAERAGALARIERLTRRDEALREERENLTDLARRLEERLAEFGRLAETVRAADAAARVKEALDAIDAESEELHKVKAAGDTARRAEPRDLDEELGELETAALVEAQMRWLKAELDRDPRTRGRGPGSGRGGASSSTPR